MFPRNSRRRGLREVIASLWPSYHQRVVKILCTEYANEVLMGRQLREHASRMPYAQFRKRLLQIADEEGKHSQWLREQIAAMGWEIPDISLAPRSGKNSWECLLMDLEEEKRCCADLEEWLPVVDRINPEIAQGLRRMHLEETSHCEEIRDMLMRSDAQASLLG